MDGFYSGYFTGISGNGFAMFILKDGLLAGADPLGVLFDGEYKPEGSGYRICVRINVPAGSTTVQGVVAGDTGLKYEVDTVIPGPLDSVPYIAIPTPFGLVNVKFRKLRNV